MSVIILFFLNYFWLKWPGCQAGLLKTSLLKKHLWLDHINFKMLPMLSIKRTASLWVKESLQRSHKHNAKQLSGVLNQPTASLYGNPNPLNSLWWTCHVLCRAGEIPRRSLWWRLSTWGLPSKDAPSGASSSITHAYKTGKATLTDVAVYASC